MNNKEESMAFAQMSCELVNLGGTIRADLFDGETVVIECSQANEEKCAELVQRTFDKFDYIVNVKFVKTGKVIKLVHLKMFTAE